MSEAGRPRLYDDPLLFEAKVNQYFDTLPVGGLGSIPTVAGLALFLGFSDRHSLGEYGKREGFSATVKRAKTLIEQDRSQRLVSKDHYTPGLQMDLVSNHGWTSDRSKVGGDEDGAPVKIQRIERKIVDPSN
ncbi:MAG: hypothetical protein HRU11_09035 [Parvularculaceae bacterium]|nr:hypothetical protein [Parvularculaceae bacterium]